MKKFSTIYSSYTPQVTTDNSLTYHSSRFDEAFHSSAGAKGETLTYFVQQNGLRDKFLQEKTEKLTLFEVGLGLGMGVKTIIEELAKAGEEKERFPHLTYISAEIDEGLVQKVIEEDESNLSPYVSLRTLKKSTLNGVTVYRGENELSCIIFLVGDLREVLPRVLPIFAGKVDFVIQDAFSWKKCPKLWTTQFFEEIHQLMKEDGVLSTYSAHTSVRKSLIEAKFRVVKAPGFGRKMASTLAYASSRPSCWNEELEKFEETLKKANMETFRDEDFS